MVLVFGRCLSALTRALGTSGSRTFTAFAADGPAAAWRRASYAPLVGHGFSIRGTATRIRLSAVTDLPHAPAGSNDAFGLMFAVPHGSIDTNRLPTLHHPMIGSFPLFVTPAATVRGTQHFQAVINRSHA